MEAQGLFAPKPLLEALYSRIAVIKLMIAVTRLIKTIAPFILSTSFHDYIIAYILFYVDTIFIIKRYFLLELFFLKFFILFF